LKRLANGELVGTQFNAPSQRLAARKQWMADHLQLRGQVRLDAGATRALLKDGKSLLPIGVGEVIAVLDTEGNEIARGLINYSSSEARRIMRKPSSEIEAVLGFIEEPELVHRSNLVLSA
jgi:glutamate 5-kinase